MNEFNKIFIEQITDLREWLEVNHQTSQSVWLVKWNKDSAKTYITYDEIVDELLCYGWIDSLPRKLDKEKTMLLISPRNPISNWSGVNKRRIKRLFEEGRMKASGIRLTELAKENGAWDFLEDVERLVIPNDLVKVFEEHEKAEFYFQRFPDSSKRTILEWIKNAKKAQTREKRIRETAKKASLNLKANHPKGRDAGPKYD